MMGKPLDPGSPGEFTPEMYRRAALDRIGSLAIVYESADFVLTAYVAGLAVECMFRAYRTRLDPVFDSRHDLFELAKAAKFAESVPRRLEAKYVSDLGIVATRWSNNHRYRTEHVLRRILKRSRFDRGIKGDFLKENARIMLNAATDLVTLGDRLWKK